MGEIWKILEKQAWKNLEYYKQNLMALSLADQSADRNVDSKDCAHEISYGNGYSIKN
jgi:hypothetical protein